MLIFQTGKGFWIDCRAKFVESLHLPFNVTFQVNSLWRHMELEVTVTNTSNLSLQKEEYCRPLASHQKLAIICCMFQGRIQLGWTLFNIHVGLGTISQQNADEFECFIWNTYNCNYLIYALIMVETYNFINRIN